jgi:hypothetical protein
VFVLYLPLMCSKQISLNNSFMDGAYVLKKSLIGFNRNALTLSFNYVKSSLGILASLSVILGLVVLFIKDKKLLTFLMLWFFLSFLFYGNLVTTVPRYFMVSSLALLIVLGYFFSWLTQTNKVIAILSKTIFVFILCIMYLNIYPILKMRHENDFLPGFYRWVGTITENNAIVIERDNSLFVDYYAKRKTLAPAVGLFSGEKDAFYDFKVEIDDLLKQGTPIYITGSALRGYNKYNPKFDFKNFMLNNYRIKFVGHHLSETWYRGCLTQKIGLFPLYKVTQKVDSGL